MLSKDALSVTSNTAKLLKHLDRLQALQNGFVSPIMVHTMPTHRCQLKCAHCCFRNRKDLVLDMDPDLYIEGMRQFHRLGVRAMELTGGGEPTLYPHIKKCLGYFIDGLQMKIGIITNGLELNRIEEFLKDISWLRISLNTLDYKSAEKLQPAIDMAMKAGTKVSFCYIWNDNSDEKIIEAAKFANANQIVCRVAPDCIMETKLIKRQMDHIRKKLGRIDSSYMFLSDFNTTLTRRSDRCYIHLIKPAFYTDGWVYPCPSAELAVEHGKKIVEEARLCKADSVFEFYANPKTPMVLNHACSYCKYSKQQDLLEDLLTETDFNDFA